MWLFQASLGISRMSILIRPDRCLESQGITKNSEEVPSCFVSVCAKISSGWICLGEDFPRVLRPQTSSQRAISWKTAWGKAKCGGLVSESCTPSPDMGLCEGREGEWRSSAKMTQATGSLFYCMWGVFYSSESEKKKKKKKSVNAAFPPPFSTLRVWGEEHLRDNNKKGDWSIKHFHTSHRCLLCSTVCSVHKEKLSMENFKHWLHSKS